MLLALVTSTIFGAGIPFASAAAITGDAGYTATVGVALPIENLEITGVVGDTPVKLVVTSGTLAFGSTTGLTFTSATSGSTLTFSGDIDDVNAALATLTYTRGSAGSDTLEVSLVEAGEVFFEGNGHLYEYVSSTLTWTAAEAAAELLTRYGSTGYLATITSSEENDFVADRLEDAGWMGASDAAIEGDWRWVTGPETGEAFWSGDELGSVVPGEYENWNAGEPNDAGSNEDCGQFLSGGSGQWNDLPCTLTTLPGYVVEFGAPGDLPDVAGESFSITTVAAPTVSTLSPADNAVDVSRTADLVLTFNTNVDVETGNITIYRANGNPFEVIDVTSEKVTGTGTSTITINPSGVLTRGGDFYVQIDATAFDSTAGGSYAGISNATTWNFSVDDAGGGGMYPVVTQPNVQVLTLQTFCDGRSAVGEVYLSATGATQYLLSNDVRLLDAEWQSLSTGELRLPWTFEEASGVTQVYAMFRNTFGSTSSAEVTVSLPTPECEEEEVVEEVVEEEEELVEPSEERSGEEESLLAPSPWDGSMEPVTDVTGATLIKGENYDTVYLLKNGKRFPFSREAVYFTWFQNFDLVRMVTDATLQTIPLGPAVLPKPETLIKIQSLPNVYVVRENEEGFPTLHHLSGEDAAKAYAGEDWAKKVIDLDVFLFVRYLIGTVI